MHPIIIDFSVQHSNDAKKIGVTICQQLFVKRILAKKPTVILITGDSGEGKSYTALKILEIVNNYFGVNTLDSMEDQIVYTPLEYSKKIKAILHDKNKKKLRCMILDEARELVSSHLWYSFVNKAIADVNALHRTVKPLVFIVVVQFIRDIDPATRRTIQFYCNCARPLNQKYVRVNINRLWKDERDIDSPKIRKRRLRGYLFYGDRQQKGNKWIRFLPTYLQVSLPEKAVYKRYEKINYERKSQILNRKLDDLLHLIEKESGVTSTKVNDLVTYFVDHPELMDMIERRVGGKCVMKTEFKTMFSLTPTEVQDFQLLLYKTLKASKIIQTRSTLEEKEVVEDES